MKSVFQKPRFDLAFPSALTVFAGVLVLGFVAWLPQTFLRDLTDSTTSFNTAFIVSGAMLLICGCAMWQEQRWAIWGGVFIFAVAGIYFLTETFKHGFTWNHIGRNVGCLFMAYSCWAALKTSKSFFAGKLSKNDNHLDTKNSLVMLLSRPRDLDTTTMASILESAWGGEYTIGTEDEAAEQFVMEMGSMIWVGSPFGMFTVQNHADAYWKNQKEIAQQVEERSMQNAISAHRGWVSVDLITTKDEEISESDVYPQIAKLIVALADEDTLAVLRPETMDVSIWNQQLAQSLLTPAGFRSLQKFPASQG